jgi:hypothetical protein
MNIKILLLSLAAVLIFGVLIGLYRTLHPYEKGFETDRIVDAETTVESGTKTIEIRANQPGWQSIGKGPLAINAVGRINYGGREAVPGKSETLAGEGSPAPGLPQGILLAKIGETGKPFKCGGVCKVTANDNIYLAINDSDYSDNSGVYTVTILRNPGEDK